VAGNPGSGNDEKVRGKRGNSAPSRILWFGGFCLHVQIEFALEKFRKAKGDFEFSFRDGCYESGPQRRDLVVP
jgi:hypothetical protein